ncbi:MAG: SapC family protein [Pseudomonadota bacterium]
MYEKPEALDPLLQGNLKLKPINDYHHAARQHMVPLVFSEIGRAAAYYPVVFLEKAPILPYALMGLREGNNSFVDKEGRWLAAYVPAYIRRYPFILGRLKTPGEFAVMIDRNASQLSETEGTPLFDGSGKVSGPVQKMIDFLNRLQKESQITQNACRRLEEAQVLERRQIEVKKSDGKSIRIGGFRTVSRERLLNLTPDVFFAWGKSGLLELVYAHLNSLNNIQPLLTRMPAGA